jgi:beta-1,4-mannosyl-glycoprotein beta-1,4-N-acetylglucosaminyltransferase
MLIDAFIFYNELDILEKRLKLLDGIVDKFVLVESVETHVGNAKPLFYEENKDRFSKWNDKIVHVIVPKNTDEIKDNFFLEMRHRDYIRKGIEWVDDDDARIMISDVDELPDPIIVQKVKPDFVFNMLMFEYSFDYMFMGEPWFGTVLTTVGKVRERGPNFFRYNRWRFPVLKQAGWHCSSFGDHKHVFNKITNYLHSGDDKHQGQTLEDFEKYVNNGIHSDGTTRLVKTPPSVLASHVKFLQTL